METNFPLIPKLQSEFGAARSSLEFLVSAVAGRIVQRDSADVDARSSHFSTANNDVGFSSAGVQDLRASCSIRRGKIVMGGAGTEPLQGYKADEMIGHNFSRFGPPHILARSAARSWAW
jgi:hypothetical protein